jgi:hypothetical protein
MIDAAKFVEAHATAEQNKQANTDGATEPNADRTHEAKPRVRLYVAQPRGTA